MEFNLGLLKIMQSFIRNTSGSAAQNARKQSTYILSLNEENSRVFLVLQNQYHKYETQSWTSIPNKKNGSIYILMFVEKLQNAYPPLFLLH
jgi:hypothetical protein